MANVGQQIQTMLEGLANATQQMLGSQQAMLNAMAQQSVSAAAAGPRPLDAATARGFESSTKIMKSPDFFAPTSLDEEAAAWTDPFSYLHVVR